MGIKDSSDKSQQNFLIRIVDRIGGSIEAVMPNLVKKAYDTSQSIAGFVDNNRWKNWVDKLATDNYVDQDTADRLKEMSTFRFPWNALLTVLTLFQVRMGELKAIMSIYMLDRQYDLMGRTTPHPAPIDNLVRSMIIDPGRATENRAELKKHGYSDLQIDNIILSYYKTVDEGTLRILFLRGIIDQNKLYERMRELGYTDERTSEIVQTWKVLPGPQDLFYMVAKEAFEPDIYMKLGLDDEFPSEQIKWLEDQGISEEWARKYWIAHWDQPSIGQGFEMLHRGVINNATLDMLFRTIEIPLYWRDKLTQIAYNPFTRVDVRRMHDHGVLTDEELIRSYMDLGYDSEKALKMAQFTLRFNEAGDAQLTRSTILESYREDLISHSEALSLLVDQDYSNEVAEYYIEMENFKREKDLRTQRIDNTREQFLMNLITISAARDELNKLGLRGEKIDALIDTWTLDKYKYASIPSKSELDRFLMKGIIDEGQYNTYMARHGFSQTAITWFMKDMIDVPDVRVKQPTKTNVDEWLKKKHITETQYQEELSRMGYSPAHIELFLKSEGRDPTRSNLDEWLQKAVITEDQYREQMSRLGYTGIQIGLFIKSKGQPTTKANLDEWLSSEAITEAEYRGEMIALGYTSEQIGLFIKSKGQPSTKANLDQWLKSEVITEAEYREGMSSLGYTTIQIGLFIASKGLTPSRANLDKWLKQGIITTNEYREGMSSLGYTNTDIGKFRKSALYGITN